MSLAEQVQDRYPQVGCVSLTAVHQFVNDVVAVDGTSGRFALKLYRPGLRPEHEVRWEAELLEHLGGCGVPVAVPVPGRNGLVESLEVEGQARLAVLLEWVPGAKPKPSPAIYELLGEAAARIHQAADAYTPRWPRPAVDGHTMIEAPISQMRPLLLEMGAWPYVSTLATRLHGHVESSDLEWGICHHDLTLDNVHLDGGALWVLDFDSAAPGWRAVEGQGVYSSSRRSSREYWTAWKTGYVSVRPLRPEDEDAVPHFALIYELGNTAWKLGLAPTSVGRLVTDGQLAEAVRSWRLWERHHLP